MSASSSAAIAVERGLAARLQAHHLGSGAGNGRSDPEGRWMPWPTPAPSPSWWPRTSPNPPKSWADLLTGTYKVAAVATSARPSQSNAAVLACAIAMGGDERQGRAGHGPVRQARQAEAPAHDRRRCPANMARGEIQVGLVWDFNAPELPRQGGRRPLHRRHPRPTAPSPAATPPCMNKFAKNPNAAMLTREYIFGDEGQLEPRRRLRPPHPGRPPDAVRPREGQAAARRASMRRPAPSTRKPWSAGCPPRAGPVAGEGADRDVRALAPPAGEPSVRGALGGSPFALRGADGVPDPAGRSPCWLGSFMVSAGEWSLANYATLLGEPLLPRRLHHQHHRIAPHQRGRYRPSACRSALALHRRSVARCSAASSPCSTSPANFVGVPLALAFTILAGVNGVVTLLLVRSGLVQDFNIYSLQGLILVYAYFQVPFAVLVHVPQPRCRIDAGPR